MREIMTWVAIGNLFAYMWLLGEFIVGLHARRAVGGPKYTRPWGVLYVAAIIVTALFVVDVITILEPLNAALNVIPTLYCAYLAETFRRWRDEDDDGNGLTSRVKRKIKSLVTVRRLVPAPAAR